MLEFCERNHHEMNVHVVYSPVTSKPSLAGSWEFVRKVVGISPALYSTRMLELDYKSCLWVYSINKSPDLIKFSSNLGSRLQHRGCRSNLLVEYRV